MKLVSLSWEKDPTNVVEQQLLRSDDGGDYNIVWRQYGSHDNSVKDYVPDNVTSVNYKLRIWILVNGENHSLESNIIPKSFKEK